MFGNAIILALREIRRNVLRSTLTILGKVLGLGPVRVRDPDTAQAQRRCVAPCRRRSTAGSKS